MPSDQPAWCCAKCGEKYGRRQAGLATWHLDTCGVCGKESVVTEPRDFGYLKPEWVKEKRA
jgi:anaerobic ribonucleoside-triphosphate reductase